MRTSQGAALVGAILIVSSLAGCTDDESSTPPTMIGPPSKVSHPPAAVPADRDKAAVLAALRQVDTCALLDPAAANVPGYPANLRPWSQGPHRCRILRKLGDDEVRVKLGVRFSADGRFDQVPVSLGGAKAYVWSSSDGESCLVRIPASFELAIEFWAARGIRSTGGDLCGAAKGFAAAAAIKLADPHIVRFGDTMPLAQWDACTLLAAALGAEAESYSLALRSSYGLDECGPDGSLRARPPDPELRLTLEYQPDPADGEEKVETIGGRRVRISETTRCWLAWSEGSSRSADPEAAHQRVQLETRNCSIGRPLAEAVIKALNAPPPGSSAPAGPLIYRPDEPDSAAPGACVDLRPNISGSCQPYVPVPVPAGAAEILRAARADPNVLCAIAVDAVRAHLGDQLMPVTSGGGCVFVEPTHSVQIAINSSADTKLEFHDGDDQETARNHRKLDLSGHPAAYYEDHPSGLNPTYHLNVSAHTGVVFGSATFYPARGLPDKTPADTTRAAKLQLVMADITSRFFT